MEKNDIFLRIYKYCKTKRLLKVLTKNKKIK